jgi:putative membrane protein
MQLFVVIALAIAVCGVAFALQNNVPVTVTFLLWRFDSSLAMVLLLALAVGVLIVAFASIPAALKSRWAMRRVRNEAESLRETNRSLQARIAALEERTTDTGAKEQR